MQFYVFCIKLVIASKVSFNLKFYSQLKICSLCDSTMWEEEIKGHVLQTCMRFAWDVVADHIVYYGPADMWDIKKAGDISFSSIQNHWLEWEKII